MRIAGTDNLISGLAAGGACRAGAAVVDITPKREVAMAGYSSDGAVGKPGDERLYARAIYLEDAGGQRMALCALDLWSASAYLSTRVSELLAGELAMDRIVLVGTHTHSGPGNYLGNGFYDTVAQSRPGFRKKVAKRLAKRVARAIREAMASARPARLSWSEAKVWGIARNRSMQAFAANFPGDDAVAVWTDGPVGAGGEAELSGQQSAIDPRLSVATAWDAQDRIIASLAIYGCHPTSLGHEVETFSRDWPGVACDVVQQALRDQGHSEAVAAFFQGCAGDVSPLPPEDGGRWLGPSSGREAPPLESFQGSKLASYVGARLGARWAQLAAGSLAAADGFELDAQMSIWRPLSHAQDDAGEAIASWNVGWPLIAGAEDGRSSFFRLGLAFEGMTSDYFEEPGRDRYQAPKKPFLGGMQSLVAKLCTSFAPSSWHPLYLLRIGSVVVATVPGEPTVMAARQLELAIADALGDSAPERALVLGFTGDYAGYYTTAAEYEQQHYEGAHTLYGRNTLANLGARVRELARRLLERGAPELPASVEVASLSQTGARLAWHAAASGLDKGERTELLAHPERGVAVAMVAAPSQKPAASVVRVRRGAEQRQTPPRHARPLGEALAQGGATLWLLGVDVDRVDDDLEVELAVGDDDEPVPPAASSRRPTP